MTDKEYREQKRRVQKYIDKWREPMGIGWFRVTFEWSRLEDGETAARTLSSWQYKNATITWFLPHLAKFTDDVVEQTVVHEFAHILLSGLAQNQIHDDESMANQINEYTTEIVANAVMWAREAGQKDKKK
jgi:hypothetical protein